MLTHLLGLQYHINYKKDIENNATNALSRHLDVSFSCSTLYSYTPQWILEVVNYSYDHDPTTTMLITKLVVDHLQCLISHGKDGLLGWYGYFVTNQINSCSMIRLWKDIGGAYNLKLYSNGWLLGKAWSVRYMNLLANVWFVTRQKLTMHVFLVYCSPFWSLRVYGSWSAWILLSPCHLLSLILVSWWLIPLPNMPISCL